ncbi:MAG: alcohol dehydrogenase catalytic domain-containing protein [Gammaproteobacteria bacterium]|nr:alcohol dehydrogenase catalytic domain-containing protein [Gammaproteobacteria bacterium]
MKAVQIVGLGEPLQLHEVPQPEPGPGEIRIKVQAAGICHSDVHYRDGTADVGFVPITPGHEVAGVVDKLGAGVSSVALGDRVALHYLLTCGQCDYCRRGLEQFCPEARMLGKDVDGGYAEYVVVPARNAVHVADSVGIAAAAIMMCSSATAFHALRRARIRAGDRVAVFGVGGLGMSGLQLTRACGATEVFAVDTDAGKLKVAESYGARPINPADGAVEQQLREATQGRGVDVALECAGLPVTQQQALASLAVHGRLALAGIAGEAFAVDSYATVINREAEIVGVSDHLYGELTTLMEFARGGLLDLDSVITERLALDAAEINRHLDSLAGFHGSTRSVIVFD